MVRTLVITNTDARKKRLLLVLEKRKKILLQITGVFEVLKDDLELIKREYYIRVGSLLKRDNELDLEVIKYKNLLVCLKQGMSYQEALDSMKDTYYSESEFAQAFAYDSPLTSDITENSDNKKEMLRALWKKIVTKFHPDLAIEPEEKKRCEEIMKQVNKAYAAGDHETMEEIYKSNHVVPFAELSLPELEDMLIQVENSIIKIRKEIVILKKSEWYRWRTRLWRAKKSGDDIFKELEHTLLDDIVKKMNILNELKRKVITWTKI